MSTIGIPRAFLYYRHYEMWKIFLTKLGYELTVSPETNKDILKAGLSLAIDESCLASKIFCGHVNWLINHHDVKSDYIFVPRISYLGDKLFTCTKFRTAPDLIRNIIKTNNYQLLTYNVDTKRGIDEEQAFLTLGEQLNQPAESVKSAYLLAKAKENELIDQHATQQNALLNLPTNKMKILIVGHDYNVFDAFVGKPIVDFLQKSDCICIYAEYLNPSETKAQAKQHSPTLRWDDSQRLFGACIQAKDKVDGIILVTAFPCGPDSMVNEMLFRKIKNIPIIQLICDEQEGTAGRETRLESFIDIIRFKKGVLNNV